MKLRLEHRGQRRGTARTGFDEVVLATGVTPRTPDIPGIDHPKVVGYAETINGAPIGNSVAVIGAGGIGFDVSEFLVTVDSPTLDLEAWKHEWGVGDPRRDARRLDQAAARAARPRRLPAAAQEGPSPAAASARRPAGSTAPRWR